MSLLTKIFESGERETSHGKILSRRSQPSVQAGSGLAHDHTLVPIRPSPKHKSKEMGTAMETNFASGFRAFYQVCDRPWRSQCP